MKSFESLLKPTSTSPELQQRLAQERFSGVVKESCFVLREAHTSLSNVPTIIIGVAASYSVGELTLLDAIAKNVSKSSKRIEIFNVACLSTWKELLDYFPLLTLSNLQPHSQQTPIAVSYELNQLPTVKTGYEARAFLIDEFHLRNIL